MCKQSCSSPAVVHNILAAQQSHTRDAMQTYCRSNARMHCCRSANLCAYIKCLHIARLLAVDSEVPARNEECNSPHRIESDLFLISSQFGTSVHCLFASIIKTGSGSWVS